MAYTWTDGELITAEKLNLRLIECTLTITPGANNLNCELTNARELTDLLKSGFRSTYNTSLLINFSSDSRSVSYITIAKDSKTGYYSSVDESDVHCTDTGYEIDFGGDGFTFSDSDIDEDGVAHWIQEGFN